MLPEDAPGEFVAVRMVEKEVPVTVRSDCGAAAHALVIRNERSGANVVGSDAMFGVGGGERLKARRVSVLRGAPRTEARHP